nr:MAG TPA: hypothetical protein [Caudoviricetes sp.]
MTSVAQITIVIFNAISLLLSVRLYFFVLSDFNFQTIILSLDRLSSL